MGEGVGVPGNIAGEFSGGKEWGRGLERLPTLPLSRLMVGFWTGPGQSCLNAVLGRVPETPPRLKKLSSLLLGDYGVLKFNGAIRVRLQLQGRY